VRAGGHVAVEQEHARRPVHGRQGHRLLQRRHRVGRIPHRQQRLPDLHVERETLVLVGLVVGHQAAQPGGLRDVAGRRVERGQPRLQAAVARHVAEHPGQPGNGLFPATQLLARVGQRQRGLRLGLASGEPSGAWRTG
jgi:hypothetical protein